MNLNEAYHYSNYLSGLIENVITLLCDDRYLWKQSVMHKKSDAVSGYVDVLEAVPYQGSVTYAQPDQMIDFLIGLLSERKNIIYAIDNAKPKHNDAELAINKIRRMVGVTLSNIGGMTKTAVDGTGRCYAINNDGNQTPFVYPTVTSYEPRYNKNHAKELGKTLMKRVEEVSNQLDVNKLTTEVNIHPMFDVTESLEDAFNSWLDMVSKEEAEAES